MVFVDPLTLAGQRAAALIPLLSEQLQYSLTVVLVPRLEITEFPLQNFYRYVTALSGASGREEGAGGGVGDAASTAVVSSAGAAARFTSLPRQHVLTVRMDIPEPWNVQSSVAQQDIDNLRCSAAQCGDPVPSVSSGSSSKDKELTSVTYALKNLLVAGQCFESAPNGQPRYNMPPNGLQLTLAEAGADRTCADTLVMQNLGYVQLQANPGLFVLSTAAGRATELYALQPGQSGMDPSSGSKFIAVRSFEDEVHRLLVRKREGKEHLSLLGDADDETEDESSAAAAAPNKRRQRQRQFSNANKKSKASNKQAGAPIKKKGGEGEVEEEAKKAGDGLWSSLSSKLFGGAGDMSKEGQSLEKVEVGVEGSTSSKVASVEQQREEEAEEDDRIHVFSLATGHMYERLVSNPFPVISSYVAFCNLLFEAYYFCDFHVTLCGCRCNVFSSLPSSSLSSSLAAHHDAVGEPPQLAQG